ncbi:chemotaxis protein CheC [Methanolobus halotolerans]|uniref:Chemotaxis protein CheC n=1 Tax=Methanolobus halotolerans TaxID=2052935 RepID=A0A4E0PYW0_9EURY|nr:chemotaxis protein CheC [Methanolobus halotolerans]TGC10720.1 chemotaxis protein CheC [Methanolobus halotolerans]
MRMEELDELQASALREIVNIGVGNAVTSLSKMIGKQIKIEVPELKIEKIEKVPEIAGGADTVVSGVIMHVDGDINGYIMMLLSQETAEAICSTISGEEHTDIFTEMNQSLIEEVGHILAGSYVSSLSEFLGLNLKISPPMQTFDMLGAIMDHILIEMSRDVESTLLFDTFFTLEGNRMEGILLTLFDPVSMDKILNKVAEMV